MRQSKHLGISVSDNIVHAVMIDAQSLRIEWKKEFSLPGFVVSRLKSTEHENLLLQGLAELRAVKEVRRAESVKVALPDPMIHVRLFQLSDLPSSKEDREIVAGMNFRKELHLDSEQIYVESQIVGERNGKNLLLSQAIDVSYLDVLGRVFQGAGLPVTYLNSASMCLYNSMYNSLVIRNPDGVLLHWMSDHWGMVGWDSAENILFSIGRWIDAGVVGEKRFGVLAPEMLRALRSYSQTFGKSWKSVHVLIANKQSESELISMSPQLGDMKLVPFMLSEGKGPISTLGEMIAYAAAVAEQS